MNISIVPLKAPLGAEIRGVDCSTKLSRHAIKLLENSLRKYQLLIFKNQKLTKKQYGKFAKIFGIYGYTLNPWKDKKNPHISIISNIYQKLQRIGLISKSEAFHSDGYDYPRLFRRILLYSIISPKKGGNTMYANLRLAYNNLSSKLKNEIKGKYILYDNIASGRKNVYRPVLIKDSVTKQKAVRVIELFSIKVKGMNKEKSKQWIKKIYAHITQKKHVYSHHWKNGDLIIWDNISLQHAASKCPKNPRKLWRILLY